MLRLLLIKIRKIIKKILSKCLFNVLIVGIKTEFNYKGVVVKNNVCIIDNVEFKFRFTYKDVKVICKQTDKILILPHKDKEVDNVEYVLSFIHQQLIINSYKNAKVDLI